MRYIVLPATREKQKHFNSLCELNVSFLKIFLSRSLEFISVYNLNHSPTTQHAYY